jgi:uncharacterized protein YjeT (DUF2065 family)
MGLILLGIFLVIVGIIVNFMDILPGGNLRLLGWVLVAVGVLVAIFDFARGPRYRRVRA